MIRSPGELPPGAYDALQANLASWREARAAGVLVRVSIQGPNVPPCPLCEAVRDVLFNLDEVPTLPLPGCAHPPCCGAAYVARVLE